MGDLSGVLLTLMKTDLLSVQRNIPRFFFRQLVIDFQLIWIGFIMAIREGQFELHVEVCDKVADWACNLDHTNYSRALPLYVHYMVELFVKHPSVYEEFKRGNFVVQRSAHKFS